MPPSQSEVRSHPEAISHTRYFFICSELIILDVYFRQRKQHGRERFKYLLSSNLIIFSNNQNVRRSHHGSVL